MTPEVEIIAEQVALAMERNRLKEVQGLTLSTLLEAARILEEKGEVQLAEAIRKLTSY